MACVLSVGKEGTKESPQILVRDVRWIKRGGGDKFRALERWVDLPMSQRGEAGRLEQTCGPCQAVFLWKMKAPLG